MYGTRVVLKVNTRLSDPHMILVSSVSNLFVRLTSHHLNEWPVGHPGGFPSLLGEKGCEHSQVVKMLATVTLGQMNNNRCCDRNNKRVNHMMLVGLTCSPDHQRPTLCLESIPTNPLEEAYQVHWISPQPTRFEVIGGLLPPILHQLTRQV